MTVQIHSIRLTISSRFTWRRFQFLKDWMLQSSGSDVCVQEKITDVAIDENKDRYRTATWTTCVKHIDAIATACWHACP